jgi:peptidase MA superfamily protein
VRPYDPWPNAVTPGTPAPGVPGPAHPAHLTHAPDPAADPWPNAVAPAASTGRSALVSIVSGVAALTLVAVTLGLTGGTNGTAAMDLIGDDVATTRRAPQAQNESRFPPPSTPPATESSTPAPASSLQTLVRKKVDTIVERHTAALAAGDQAGFLDRLDPATPALGTDRKRLFDNLRKIPFDTARWTVSTAEFTAADGSSVRTPGTAAAWPVTGTLDIGFEHAITGVDVANVRELYVWKVRCVDPADACTVTSVEGAKDTKRQVSGYPAPWDLWDLSVEKRAHVLLMGPKADAAVLRSRATTAENAAVYTLGAWKGGPGTSPGFALVVTSSRKSFTKLYSSESVRDWVAGFALSLPGEKLPVGGARLVVDDEELSYDADFSRSLLRHEMTHALVATLFRYSSIADEPPTWLVEGFADWQADADHPLAGSVSARDIRNQIDRRKFTGEVPSDEDFETDDTERVEHAYNLSHLAVRYLADTYGAAKVGQFVTAVYAGTYDSIDSTLKNILGTEFEEFQTNWAAWVKKKV